MDLNSFNQLIAGISLAFAAGLTHRPVQPAPHFHFPAAPSCEEVDQPAAPGWPSWAVCLAIFVAYFLGGVYPSARIGRGLLARLVRWLDVATPASSSEPPSLFRE